MAAFKLAKQAAEEGDCLVSISITEPMSYRRGASEEEVKGELRQQLRFFVDENCKPDFVICEVKHPKQQVTSFMNELLLPLVPRVHSRT